MAKRLIITVLVSLSLIFASCAPPPTPAPEVPLEKPTDVIEPTEPIEEPSQPPAEATAAPSEFVEPVKVIYWSYLSETEPIAQILAAKVKTWNENNPNIQVEASWVGREVITKLRTALLSGEAPDIISHSDSELLPSVIKEGLGYPLDDALKTPAYNSSENWKDTFIRLDPYMDGHYYLIPEAFYTSGIFYNVDLFDKNNLQPPKTWAEFLDVCAKLKDNGVDPLAVNGAFPFFSSWYFTWLASRIVGDEEFRAAAKDPTGEAWDAPGFLEAAKQVELLVKNGYFQEGYEGTNWPGAETLFSQGNVGMYLTGTWFPAEISDKVGEDFKTAVIPFPTVEGGKADQTTAEAWSNSWMILKDAKNPEAAIKFLKYMSSLEAMSEFAKVMTPAPLKGVPLPRFTEGQEGILMNANKVMPRLHGVQDDSPEWVTTVFWVVDDQLIFGQISAEEFIQKLKAEQVAFFNK